MTTPNSPQPRTAGLEQRVADLERIVRALTRSPGSARGTVVEPMVFYPYDNANSARWPRTNATSYMALFWCAVRRAPEILNASIVANGDGGVTYQVRLWYQSGSAGDSAVWESPVSAGIQFFQLSELNLTPYVAEGALVQFSIDARIVTGAGNVYVQPRWTLLSAQS